MTQSLASGLHASTCQLSASRYLGHALAPLGLMIAGAIAFAFFTDPYMLRTADPGVIHPVPVSLRLTKPLQVLRRNPETIFLGSSRTLLGIDPQHISPDAYNFGVSGLTGPELEMLGKLCLNRTRVKRLIINVDEFMFDAHAGFEGGLGPDTGSNAHLLEARIATLLSFDCLKDSYRTLTGFKRRGTWRPDGLMISPERDAHFIDHELAMAAERQPNVMSDEKFGCLDRLLAECVVRGVETTVYIPPIHNRLLETLARRDGPQEYVRFREGVKRIAERHAIPCWDFGPSNRITGTPLVEPTELYIDTAHYTARVGDLLLYRMGFDVRPHEADQIFLSDLVRPKNFVMAGDLPTRY